MAQLHRTKRDWTDSHWKMFSYFFWLSNAMLLTTFYANTLINDICLCLSCFRFVVNFVFVFLVIMGRWKIRTNAELV